MQRESNKNPGQNLRCTAVHGTTVKNKISYQKSGPYRSRCQSGEGGIKPFLDII